MGKGIAVLFREKFGGIDELRRQKKTVGEVAELPHGNNIIYYLITKPRYWDKPTYESLDKTLVYLRDRMVSGGFRKLGMPKIGCGLDGLSWPKVKEIIETVFGSVDVEIVVCIK